LNTKLDEVSQKMKALQEDFKAGKISLEEYQTASADLESQKASLTAEIDKETQKLQENQAVLGNTTERLKENIAELERLEAQKNLNNQLYEDGMITEEAAIATNESLSKKIAELTKENRDLQLSQQDVQDIINSFSAARTIDELNKQVAKAKDVVKANINAARSFIALQELRGEEVDTKALQKFLATQQEIAKTIDQQAKVQKEVIQSGKLPSIDS
jgi:DNA repair exonuclease SbcCD ATPase subunit